MPILKCSVCGKNHNKKASYCSNCGHEFHHAKKESVSATIGEVVWHFIFHLSKNTFIIFWRLLSSPGKTLRILVYEADNYKKSITYFLTTLGFYTLITEFVFAPLCFKYLLSSELGPHIAPFILLILLIIIAFLGYITLGWRAKSTMRDDYSFSEVLVISPLHLWN